MPSPKPLRTIENDLVKALQTYVADGMVGTESLRAAAEASVAAREHFFTADGEPDWLGRTHAYRTWSREMFTRAGVDPTELTKLQSSVRYHVSAALRERLSEDVREDLGLRAETARERSAERHGKNVEVLSIFGGGGAIQDAATVAKALRMMDAALHRVDPAGLRRKHAPDREAVLAGLDNVAGALAELRAAIEARSS
jgi:hypothetical protein